jgi:hypothetical protein
VLRLISLIGGASYSKGGFAMTREEKVAQFKAIVAKCRRFEVKGKTLPYTSANGHMFSQINKDGELGIRFSGKTREKYLKDLKTTVFTSYGKAMNGYVLMPETLWADPEALIAYLNESYDYVMSLDPK